MLCNTLTKTSCEECEDFLVFIQNTVHIGLMRRRFSRIEIESAHVCVSCSRHSIQYFRPA
jgi:hypothetical protein